MMEKGELSEFSCSRPFDFRNTNQVLSYVVLPSLFVFEVILSISFFATRVLNVKPVQWVKTDMVCILTPVPTLSVSLTWYGIS
jgi:hypothetical protein